MTFHRSTVRTLLVCAILLFTFLFQGAHPGVSATTSDLAIAEAAAPQSLGSGRTVLIRLDDDGPVPPAVPPPAAFARAASTPTASIFVNYIGPWTPAAQAAFQYAADIWETLISSPVTIVIDAEWGALPPGVLGGAGPEDFYRDFPNAPASGTWYPIALANSLAGSDLQPASADIGAIFSSSYSNWYFGTDGNPGGQIDFVSVVLHEIGHGLGFSGSMVVDNGVGPQQECRGIGGEGCWGRNTAYPFTYDRFTENGSNQGLINTGLFANPSAVLGGQLIGNDIYFDGPNTTAANGGVPARLYAPGSWEQGSSYSHLNDATYDGSANALMTHAIAAGEANHNPGPVGMGMLEDMGWLVSNANSAPAISIPNQLLEMDTDKTIDLWSYTNDTESADNALTFTLVDDGNADAGVTLSTNRYININPAPGWTGETTVTVQVTDVGGLSSTASFNVIVVAELETIYLPAILRNN